MPSACIFRNLLWAVVWAVLGFSGTGYQEQLAFSALSGSSDKGGLERGKDVTERMQPEEGEM